MRKLTVLLAVTMLAAAVLCSCQKNNPTKVIVEETVIVTESYTNTPVPYTPTKTPTPENTATRTATRTVTATSTASCTVTVTKTPGDILVDGFEDADFYNNIDAPANAWDATESNGYFAKRIIASAGSGHGAYALSVTETALGLASGFIFYMNATTTLGDRFLNGLDLTQHSYLKMHVSAAINPSFSSSALTVTLADREGNTASASVNGLGGAGFAWQEIQIPLSSYTGINKANITYMRIALIAGGMPSVLFALNLDTVRFTLY